VRNEAFAKRSLGIVGLCARRAVAVIAKEFWRAKKAVEALDVSG